MPRVMGRRPEDFEHTFAWRFLLEPRQKVDLFGEGTPMPPVGVGIHGDSPPYVRFPMAGAVLTQLGCSTSEALITLVVDFKPRTFAGPWLTHPECSKLDPPIIIGRGGALKGSVTSTARDTRVVHVWLRARLVM